MKERACEVGLGHLLEACGWLWADISMMADVTKGKGMAPGKGTRGAGLSAKGSKRHEAK